MVSRNFFNAEIVVSGDYHQTQGMNIHFEAKPIDLKPWSELVPMLKEYELEGKLTLDGAAKGKPEGELTPEEERAFQEADTLLKIAILSILGDKIVDPYLSMTTAKGMWDACARGQVWGLGRGQ